MAAEPKLLRVRLNNIDTYRVQPTELDPQLPLTSEAPFQPRIPIIRVFGTTEDGENICAHIHGAFPYLYTSYHAPYNPLGVDFSFTAEQAQHQITRLRLAIDKALAASSPGKNRPTPDGKIPQSVATIALIKAVPFYGYQVGWKLFCKIYLYEPRQINRLAQLLLSGAIMKAIHQPYEAHLGYTHQFMIDHNLYGCNFIDVPINKVKWRKIHEDYEDADEPLVLNNGHKINRRKLLPPDKYPSHVYAGWEVDFRAQDIWNVNRVQERPWHQDLKERDIPFDKDMKLVHSLRDLWTRHSNGEDIDSDAEYGAGLTRPIWLNEPGYRKAISDLVKVENKKYGPFTEEKIPRRVPAEEHIPTAYESIGYLASYYDRSVFATQMPTQYVPNNDHPEEEDDNSLVNLDIAANVEVEDEDPDEVDYESADEYELLGEKKNYFSEQAEVDFEKEADANEEEMQDVIAPRDAWVKTDLPPDIASELEAKKDSAKSRPVSRDESPTRDKKRRKLDGPKKAYHQEAPRHEPQRPARNYNRSGKFSKQVQLLADQDRNLNEVISIEELEIRVTNHILPDIPKEEEKEISYQIVEKEYLEAVLNPTNEEEQHDFQCLVDNVYDVFEIDSKRKVVIFNTLPPTTAEVEESLKGQNGQIHRKAFYGNPDDVPDKPFEFGGEFYRLDTTSVSKLPPFDPLGEKENQYHSEPEETGVVQEKTWVFAIPPPTYDEVMAEFEEIKKARTRGEIGGVFGSIKLPKQCSQLDGPTQEFPTQKERQGFSFTQIEKLAVQKQKASGNMTVMSLEVHVNTRGDLWPDPEKDPVECIFWCLQASDEDEQRRMGVLTLGDGSTEEHIKRFFDVEVKAENTELGLFNSLTDLVRELDPDILAGWEVHSSSWGYVVQRAAHTLQMQLTDDFSRVKEYGGGHFGKDADPWGQKKSASMRVVGRHSINIWRAMRGELAINSYTQENVTFKLLNRRIPHYSYSYRTKWYMQDWKNHGRAKSYCRVLNYYFLRVRLDLDLLNKQDFITRISEQARIIGIDFNQVLSRGSQLKVESLMFRIAKPESYMLISPSRRQVAAQHSIECRPLIMEPISAFYTDPVIVLDFQSLYPSIMIGHNYCYSTCLGRIVDHRENNVQNRLGVLQHYIRPDGIMGVVEKDMVNVSPTGLVFVKDTFRKSLLAKMLQEILDTRIMVKKRMKDKTIDKTLRKKLDSWQKALKLIANVTYGYTSATFSGRMPCVEIADCIVQTGRETLEKAIKMIHQDESWGAHVVYGDTDSLFIHLPGKTKAQAFDIGYAIADRVTAMNPKPVKLKFEKVYHPCILMAMKRYVGYKYEDPDQVEPVWDAKGIETVRRDGTPAMQKIMKKSIELLFKTKDVSQVKAYVQSQWIKIMQEKVSIQDFCFGKEVKLGTYSEKGAIQPGVKVAYDRMKKDPRREPQYGERLPFVVIAGESKKIADRAVEVEWLLHSDRLALDSTYYIRRKLIPPLARVFNIVGSDVEAWYRETPKFQPLSKVVHTKGEEATQKEIEMAETRVQTLEMFMSKDGKSCPLCEEMKPKEDNLLCANCLAHRDRSFYEVQERLKTVEKSVIDLQEICRSCAGCSPIEEVPCDSTDCEVYYSRVRQNTKLKTYQASSRNLIRELHEAEKKERKERQEMIDRTRVMDVDDGIEYGNT